LHTHTHSPAFYIIFNPLSTSTTCFAYSTTCIHPFPVDTHIIAKANPLSLSQAKENTRTWENSTNSQLSTCTAPYA